MIEALIDLRIPRPTQSVRQGDVIAVKLAGSPWGRQEIKEFLIVRYDEPDVEAELVKMRNAGDPNPTIVYPYAEYENGDDTKRMYQVSLWVVRKDRLSPADQLLLGNTLTDLLPGVVTVPDLAWVELTPLQAGFMLRWTKFFVRVIQGLRAFIGI